jgi:hypothetical protein
MDVFTCGGMLKGEVHSNNPSIAPHMKKKQ